MFTELLVLAAVAVLVFVTGVSLLVWDSQRFFKRALARVNAEAGQQTREGRTGSAGSSGR